MRATKQAKDQNVYQHGLSVFRHAQKLITKNTEGFKLPQWYVDYNDQIIESLHDFKTIKHYTTWHDCSKGFIRTVDSEGRQHFPDHANKSYELWNTLFPDRNVVGKLIHHDMDLHTLPFDQLDSDLDIHDLSTLLIVALAELHSNAKMFGGIESTSFLIKFKKLEKLGIKICKKYFDHAYVYVLVRNDLSNAQKAVQSAHAAIESSRKFLKAGDEHPSIIICTVKNENKLIKCSKELDALGVEYVTFREPDIGNAITAIASKPLIGKERKVFARFQLLT